MWQENKIEQSGQHRLPKAGDYLSHAAFAVTQEGARPSPKQAAPAWKDQQQKGDARPITRPTRQSSQPAT